MKKNLLILLLFVSSLSYSQTINVDKYKSLFTINFIRFIGWTDENKTGDFIIGVVKNKNLTNEFITATVDKKFGFQDIKIKYFESIEEISDCQILYISEKQYLNVKNFELIKLKTKSKPTLIITESTNGIEFGSMINFIIVDDKLKFELDIHNFELSGLTISNALKSLNNAIVK